MAVEAKAGTAAHSLTLAMDHAQGRLCLELERSVLKQMCIRDSPGCAQGAHESVHLQHPVFLTGRRDTGRAGAFEGASGLICAFLILFY